jgi:hypothetical protein
MPRATRPTGPRCRHCEQAIERTQLGFVHLPARSVYCFPDVIGSRFAEPG